MRSHRAGDFPADFTPEEIEDILAVSPYTMTSRERLVALIRAVRYIVENQIPGDIVECGVWKGGSMMAVARTLLRLGCADRDLWLYDTFEGMTEPGAADVSFDNQSARDLLDAVPSTRCASDLDCVKNTVLALPYPPEKIHFVRGRVEETIPGVAPAVIALLRLDTDWYESTRHELVHFFPRLARGGILIIDDYGHWRGAQQATDEYLRSNRIPLYLGRIDYTGRIGVKL
jgi:hypothetical protein